MPDDTAAPSDPTEAEIAMFMQEMLSRPARKIPYELLVPWGYDATGLDVHDDDIRATNYAGVILRQANLQCCDCRQQEFTNCDLRGADLSGAWLLGASFRHALIDADTCFDKAIYDEHTLWATPESPAPPGAVQANDHILTIINSGQVSPRILFGSKIISQVAAAQ